MAENVDQAQSATDAAESAGDSTEAKAEETLPKSQVEKLIAARVAKLRSENERLKRELEAAAKQKRSDDDDEEESKPGAPPDERWRKRIERMRAEAEVERQELLAKLESETRAHQRTRIEHAVLAECARRGNVRDVPLVMRLVLEDLEVGDDGAVRAKDGVTDLGKFLDNWLKEHEVFVAAPPRGDGLRVGGVPGAAGRSVADLPEFEAYGVAARRLVGAK